jgi:hypothetical protein
MKRSDIHIERQTLDIPHPPTNFSFRYPKSNKLPLIIDFEINYLANFFFSVEDVAVAAVVADSLHVGAVRHLLPPLLLSVPAETQASIPVFSVLVCQAGQVD